MLSGVMGTAGPGMFAAAETTGVKEATARNITSRAGAAGWRIVDDAVSRDVDDGAWTRWLCGRPCRNGIGHGWRSFREDKSEGLRTSSSMVRYFFFNFARWDKSKMNGCEKRKGLDTYIHLYHLYTVVLRG